MLTFRHPTLLAPMEGVTHPVFRAVLAEKAGLGLVATEFVRISRGAISHRHLAKTVIKVPGLPLCVQVMGNDVDKLADAAGCVAAAGADVVDINLGCPSPRVVRRGAGSALLKDPELLYRIVSGMRRSVPGLLSAKIRAGFDHAEDVLRIAGAVEAAGADFITVHPRRRVDFYQGVADWRTIRMLKTALRIPVVGNGDVWYAADALRMRRETGCDAVMIGRPALRNPWIFEQILALEAGVDPFVPTGVDVFEYFLHVRDVYAGAFRGQSLGRLKELLRYLLRAFPGRRSFESELLRENDVDALLTAFERRARSAGALDLQADPEAPLERSGAVEITTPNSSSSS